jgi:GPI mannosyltransferase 1 subunit M
MAINFFSSPQVVFAAAALLRVALLGYGTIQDKFSPMKYTDIDYYVFTDAAASVARGLSPYDRDTYRYTPLLAWIVYPTTWKGLWFLFGKVIFAAGDIVAGYLIYQILRTTQGLSKDRALKFASIWLLNPMVAQISTRGSSEGLVCMVVISLLWAVVGGRNKLAGCLLGFAVHFKIYPFIYATSIIWWLDQRKTKADPKKPTANPNQSPDVLTQLADFITGPRLEVTAFSLLTFLALNTYMLLQSVSTSLCTRPVA